MNAPRLALDRADVGAVLPGVEVVDALPVEALPALVAALAALQARAASRLLATRADAAVSGEYLTVEQTATLLLVSEEWVYKQAARWNFAAKLAPKVLRIERAGLLRWMAQRQRR